MYFLQNIAGQIGVSSLIYGLSAVFRRFKRVLIYNAVQLPDYLVLRLASQERTHIRQIHTRALGNRHGERLDRRVHSFRHGFVADSPRREHIRKPFEISFGVKFFKRAKQEIARIRLECLCVSAAVDNAVLRGIAVIELPQLALLRGYILVGVSVQLIVYKLSSAVSERDKPFYPLRSRPDSLFGLVHYGIFPIIYLAIDDGVAVVPHGRVCRYRLKRFFLVFVKRDRYRGKTPFNMRHSFREHISKVFAFDRAASRSRPVGRTRKLQLAAYHFRMPHEIFIDRYAVVRLSRINPFRLNVHHALTLL